MLDRWFDFERHQRIVLKAARSDIEMRFAIREAKFLYGFNFDSATRLCTDNGVEQSYTEFGYCNIYSNYRLSPDTTSMER